MPLFEKCRCCQSHAINPEHHGRVAGVDLDLCDVCYWRKRAGALPEEWEQISAGDRRPGYWKVQPKDKDNTPNGPYYEIVAVCAGVNDNGFYVMRPGNTKLWPPTAFLWFGYVGATGCVSVIRT